MVKSNKTIFCSIYYLISYIILNSTGLKSDSVAIRSLDDNLEENDRNVSDILEKSFVDHLILHSIKQTENFTDFNSENATTSENSYQEFVSDIIDLENSTQFNIETNESNILGEFTPLLNTNVQSFEPIIVSEITQVNQYNTDIDEEENTTENKMDNDETSENELTTIPISTEEMHDLTTINNLETTETLEEINFTLIQNVSDLTSTVQQTQEDSTNASTITSEAVTMNSNNELFETDMKILKIIQGKPFQLNCDFSDINKDSYTVLYKDEEFLAESNTSSVKIDISNAQLFHQGIYNCFSFSFENSIYKSYNLKVEVLTDSFDLNIYPNRQILVIKEGNSQEIKCNLITDLKSDVYLFRNNKHLLNLNESLIYRIENSSKSDEGRYMCYAFSKDKTIYKYQIIDIFIETKREIFAFEKDNVILTCSLNDEFSNLTWLKSDSGNILDSYDNEGNLVLSNLKIHDSGQYECRVNNSIYEIIKLNVKSSDIQKKNYHITRLNNKEIFANLGATIRQICSIETNEERLEVIWLNQNKSIIEPNDRITIKSFTSSQSPLNQVSILTIKDLKQTDYGIYECNYVSFNSTEGSKFTIAEDKRFQIHTSFSEKYKKLKFDESFLFTCSIDDPNEDTRIILYKNNLIVETSKIGKITYRIYSAKKSDDAEYFCQAYSVSDSNKKYESKSIKIEIDYPNELLISENSNFTVWCSLNSNGQIGEWKKLNKSLDHQTNNGRLVFKHFNHLDTGEYTCTVNNKTEKIDLTLINTHGVESRSFLKMTDIIKKPGSHIEQVCTAIASGFSLPESLSIQWFKSDGKLLGNDEKFDIQEYITNLSPLTKISVLNITFLDNKDYGSYECKVSYGHLINTLEFNLSNPLASKTKDIPKFYKEILEIVQGDDYTLECLTNENIKKNWLINNKNVIENTNFKIKEDGSLIILNASVNMSGFISCKTNQDGIVAQNSIKLIVRQGSRLIISSNVEIMNKKIKIDRNKDLILECFGNKSGKIEWVKINGTLDNQHHFINDSTLLIMKIQSDQSGIYECNSEDEEMMSQIVEIIVEEKTTSIYTTTTEKTPNTLTTSISTKIWKKTIVSNDSELEFEKGLNIELYCLSEQIDGIYKNFLWTKLNEVKLSSNANATNNLLKITDFKEDNEGIYECTYEDHQKKSLVSNLIIKKPTIDPTAKILTKNIELEYGQNYSVECKVTGHPILSVIWLFKNETIANDDKFQIEHNILNIKNADETYNGQIACRSIGANQKFDQDTATISVLEPKVKIRIDPKELRMIAGETVTFKCTLINQLETIEDLKFVWYKNNQIIDNKNKSELTIMHLSGSSAGNYSCQVFAKNIKSKLQTASLLVDFEETQVQNKLFINITSNQKIDYLQQSLVVKQFDNVTLDCHVSKVYKDAVKVWQISYANDTFIEIEGKKLVLNNVTQEFSGSYECIVKNNDESYELISYLIELFVLVYEPLKVKIHTVIEGDLITLNCMVIQGLPDAKANLTKDGKRIDYSLTETIQFHSHIINLNKSNTDSFGLYKCSASNEFDFVSTEILLNEFTIEELSLKKNNTLSSTIIGQISSSPKTYSSTISTTRSSNPKTSTIYKFETYSKETTTTAFIPFVGNWSIKVNRSLNYEFSAGSNIELICSSFITSDTADLTYKWISKLQNKISENIKIFDNILKITNLEYSNENQYECKIQNEKSKKIESIIVNLIVRRKPEPPTAEIVNKIIQLKTSNLTVICMTSGYPKPKLIWYYNEKEIKNMKHFYALNNILLIRNPSPDLKGYITCEARNNLNETAKSNAFLVYGNFNPVTVNIDLNKNNVTIGSDVVFNCSVNNFNNSDGIEFIYDWFKDDVKFTENSTSYSLKINSSDDAGFYSCQARDIKNTLKSNIASVYLKIFEKFHIKLIIESDKNISNKVITVKEGDNLTLSCTPKRLKNHFITTKWLNFSMFDAKYFHLSSNGSLLKISNISLEHSGQYSCIGEANDDTIDSVTDNITINVEKYNPIKIEIYLKDEIEEVLVDCLVDGYPTPTAIWVKVDNNTQDIAIQNVLEFGGVQLILNKTENSTLAIYECVAENKFEIKINQITFLTGKNSNDPLTHPDDTTTAEILETTILPTRIINSTMKTQSTSLITSTMTTNLFDISTSISRILTTTNPITISRKFKKTTHVTNPTPLKQVINENKVILIEVGSNIDLECDVSKLEQNVSSIGWYSKDGLTISQNVSNTKTTLKIRDFDFYDSGDYFCIASIFGKQIRFNVTLKAKESPVQVKLKETYYEFQNGNKSFIECTTYPNFNRDQNFIRNIQWLINDKDASKFKYISPYRTKLYINNATDELHGVVTCRAVLYNENFAEDTAVIRMNKRKSLLVDIYPKISNLSIGDNVVLNCILIDLDQLFDFSNVEFMWKKDGKIIKENKFIYDDKQGTLKIKNLSLHNSGVYSCQAIEYGLKSNLAKAKLDVFEIKTSNFLEIKSTKNITDKKIYLRQTENITLECIFNSNDPAPVKWYKVDGNLDPAHQHRSTDGSSLHMIDLNHNHNGRYSCVAPETDAKSEPISDYVEIFVEKYEPIEIIIKLNENNEFFFLECSIESGYPLPTIKWSKNNDDLSRFKTEQHSGYSKIILNKNDKNIYGNYECQSTNKYEFKSKAYKFESIKPNSKDYRVSFDESYLDLNEGDSYSIECILEGFKENEVEWLFNNKLIKNYQEDNYLIKGNELQILNANKKHIGSITCRASNNLIEKSDSIWVDVREIEKEIRVEIEPKYYEGYEGDTVTFKCKVLTENLNRLNYIWFKTDNQFPIGINSEKLILERVNLESSGNYYCKVKEIDGYKESDLAMSTLNVRSVPMKIYNQGEYAVLVCGLLSSSSTIFKWRKIGNISDPSRHYSTEDKYIINDIQVEDRGDYECLAETNSDVKVEYIRIEVQRREKPKAMVHPNQANIDSHSRYPSIICRAEAGIPEPVITWRRKDKKQMSSRVNVKNNVLSIRDTQPEDYGVYECVASNELGEDIQEIIIKKPIKY